MYIYDIIEKKRKKLALTKEEIQFVITSFVNHTITDAQMSSLLMAIVLNGMNYEETLAFTLAMKNSSETLQFSEFIVDKHSTGGVSDTTTLLVVPILASLGVKIAKMSGRSLGFTGGTIDKLEVFEGYQVEKSLQEFEEIVKKINCSIISQTADLAYADKLIYSLRNQTATVDSIPLIASSIMSKKLAGGAKFLLLNVHFGSGAFMESKRDALKLAKLMVKIGNASGVPTKAVVSNMNTPLASGVGCSEEVLSALNALHGENSLLLKLSKVLAREILVSVKNITPTDAEKQVNSVLKNKAALHKLSELILVHGGNAKFVANPKLVPHAKHTLTLNAPRGGYVNRMDARTVAKVVNHLKQLNITESTKKLVGVRLLVTLGQKVKAGDAIAEIHFNTNQQMSELEAELKSAFTIGNVKRRTPKLIEKIM